MGIFNKKYFFEIEIIACNFNRLTWQKNYAINFACFLFGCIYKYIIYLIILIVICYLAFCKKNLINIYEGNIYIHRVCDKTFILKGWRGIRVGHVDSTIDWHRMIYLFLIYNNELVRRNCRILQLCIICIRVLLVFNLKNRLS